MARLEAQAKMLYYPTPEPVVQALAQFLYIPPLPDTEEVRLLDPCAGQGEALALLSTLLVASASGRRLPLVSTYGIEPHLLRARAAHRRLTHVLATSFFSASLSNGDGPDGGWQCAFVNPPYDVDYEAASNEKKLRLEVNFLYRATHKLCAKGILIWIVPQRIVRHGATFLASFYDRITCYRFPDTPYTPEGGPPLPSLYEQFKQVVLIAEKRHAPIAPSASVVARLEAWAEQEHALTPLPLNVDPMHGRYEFYRLPAARGPLRLFQANAFDADNVAALVHQTGTTGMMEQGAWAKPGYWSARLPQADVLSLGIGQPLAPLKHAHLAVLTVAGIANGVVLTGTDGRRILVKGSSRKATIKSCVETEEEIIEKTTDRFDTALWGLDLETGHLLRVETGSSGVGSMSALPMDTTSLSLPDFLSIFGASLAEQVAIHNPPRYRHASDVPWAARGFAQLKRKPLGKQRDTILAMVHSFLSDNATAAHGGHGPGSTVPRMGTVAEMATGKTYLSLCTAYLADLYACGGLSPLGLPPLGSSTNHTHIEHLFPLVILCPPIMARKWKREAEQTLPGVRAIIVKRITGGSKEAGHKPALRHGQQDDDEDEETRGADDLAALRRFDPTFTRSSISAIGCLDRVVSGIQRDLADWQHRYDETLRHNRAQMHAYRDARRTVQPCDEGEMKEEAASPTSPALSSLPRKPMHIVILTSSTAKLGAEWHPVYTLKAARTFNTSGKIVLLRDEEAQPVLVPACPGCGRLLVDERELRRFRQTQDADRSPTSQGRQTSASTPVEEEAALPLSVYLCEADLQGTGEHRKKYRCAACGEALWQYAPSRSSWKPSSVLLVPADGYLLSFQNRALPLPERGHSPAGVTDTTRRRFPVADYLRRRYRGIFHLLIADEVHEGADGTALDFARQSLAQACGRMLGLTGTLSNGYSRSLFRLYYTLNADVRHRFGYSEDERWVDLYGRRQVIQKTRRETDNVGHGAVSKRRTGAAITKELAGFAPAGLAHVLPCSAFLELSDVAPDLPPYREEVRVVPMGEMLGPVYEIFQAEATRELGKMLAHGDKSGLSSWLNGMLIYPNMPYLGWVCRIKRTGRIFGEAPALPEEMVYPKEQALLDFIQHEAQAGRRVLIYSENTGYYDIMPRLKSLIEQHVRGAGGKRLSVAILRSTTVETIEREAWLTRHVEAGCDVLICNPRLVKVGLDLIAFPTIVYASIPTSTSDLRQSSRRSWRPGQTQAVKVVFFVYPSMESRLLRLMAQKMKASLMVEGKLPGEGLVSFGEDEENEDESDLMVRLAREVLASLEQHQQPTTDSVGTSVSAGEEDMATELDTLFRQAAVIEREQQRAIGTVTHEQMAEEGKREEMEPMHEEIVAPLPFAGSHEQEAMSSEQSALPPSFSRPSMPPEQPVAPAPPTPLKVTVIPISVTASVDPWAELRQQYRSPKRSTRKRTISHLSTPDLWTASVQEALPVTDLPLPEAESHLPSPSTLWG